MLKKVLCLIAICASLAPQSVGDKVEVHKVSMTYDIREVVTAETFNN